MFLGSPPCNTYRLKSDFEIGKPGTGNASTKSGLYSFGIGRKHYERVYLPQ